MQAVARKAAPSTSSRPDTPVAARGNCSKAAFIGTSKSAPLQFTENRWTRTVRATGSTGVAPGGDADPKFETKNVSLIEKFRLFLQCGHPCGSTV
jgi:hypothetical protein